jgi:hypothetical protein
MFRSNASQRRGVRINFTGVTDAIEIDNTIKILD